MAKELKGKQVAKNISLSLFAQIVSLVVSFILGMVVPKFIDEYQYAHWHTFLLYVSYVGVLHFGLLDGIVLRYSQYDYEELDKTRIRSQFVALLAINSVAVLILIVFGVVRGGFAGTVAVLVAFGILTKNVFTYNSFLFQITNRINKYAFIIMAQRLTYGVMVLLLIAYNQQGFIWFCIADLVGDCVGIAVSLLSNKELHFGPLLPMKEIVNETRTNISAGILLMVANWSSMLLVGGAKMMIEWKWGALVFGKVSFAFSVSHLVLVFVSAISVVLFPSLKRMQKESLPLFYKKLRNMITPVLFWGLLLYFPECYILEKWLPNYFNSLIYLGLLFPLIVYTSVVSLLTNNYLKAYRKERAMLIINGFSILLAVSLYSVSAYLLENFTLMLIFVVLAVMLRSIISELFIMKLLQITLKKDFLLEFIMTCAFLISAQCFSKQVGFLFYLTFLLIYSYINRSSIKTIFVQVKTLLLRKKVSCN